MLSKILSRHSEFSGCSTQRKEWQKLRIENEGEEERETWKRKKRKKKIKRNAKKSNKNNVKLLLASVK